jgi:hypothetical protein
MTFGSSLNTMAILSLSLFLASCGKSVFSEKLGNYYDEKVKGDETGDGTEKGFNLNGPIPYVHAAKGWNISPITMQIDVSFNERQVEAIETVVTNFNAAVGFDLIVVGERIPERDGTFDLYDTRENQVLDVYQLKNWSVTNKPNFVIATAISEKSSEDENLISSAHILLNTQLYKFVDALATDTETLQDDDREIVDMETLFTHELGHALGLSHRNLSSDPHTVMSPSVFVGKGLAHRNLSDMDIALLNAIYR